MSSQHPTDVDERRPPTRRRLVVAASVAGVACLGGAGVAQAGGDHGHAARHGHRHEAGHRQEAGHGHGHHGGHHDGRVSPINGQPDPSAAVPTVTEAPAGSVPQNPDGVLRPSQEVLDRYGYEAKEYFVSGTANAFRFDSPPGDDGRWDVSVDPGSRAAYRTRVVVLTPKDRRRFSGNTVVEWNNVTAGNDAAPDLIYDHDRPFRNGDAYVLASAQFGGVAAAKSVNPDRYGALSHPGDSWSYDMYSQIGMAVRRNAGGLLGRLRPRAVIADGESQSAGRMVIYANALAKTYNVFDGYLIHSRAGGSFPLQQAPSTTNVTTDRTGPSTPTPDGNAGRHQEAKAGVIRIRTDLEAPTLTLQSESDVYSPAGGDGVLAYAPDTQANSRSFRLWEVAGASHVDDYVLNLGTGDTGSVRTASRRLDRMLTPPRTFTLGNVETTCPAPINTGQHGYVTEAALAQLTRWVRTGGADGGRAAAAPPLFAGQAPDGAATDTAQRDGDGNIVGGVRTPSVDVPIATLTGKFTADPSCSLSGTTTPFSAAELRARYPTHASFVSKWTASVRRQVRAGFITPASGRRLIEAARRAPVPDAASARSGG